MIKVSDERLLPCPFCGDPMEVHFNLISHVNQGACVIGASAWPDERASSWNTRSQPEPAGVRVADTDEEDLASDDRWNAGVNYAITQLCEVFGIDPKTINWDAATETLDGDVRSVLCNVLTTAYGAEWSSDKATTGRILSALTQQQGEAVAWRYRHNADGEWIISADGPKVRGFKAAYGYEVQPLYAAPSNPVISDEMVEQVFQAVAPHIAGTDWREVRAALTAALSVKPQSGSDKP